MEPPPPPHALEHAHALLICRQNQVAVTATRQLQARRLVRHRRKVATGVPLGHAQARGDAAFVQPEPLHLLPELRRHLHRLLRREQGGRHPRRAQHVPGRRGQQRGLVARQPPHA